jgi:hypothetical protein
MAISAIVSSRGEFSMQEMPPAEAQLGLMLILAKKRWFIL